MATDADRERPYDGGNTTGFASPATIYLEAVIDLAAILDLRQPSRYPVRVMGGSYPAKGIAERDILVVDAAADRAADQLAVVMDAGDIYLAVLKRLGPSWAVIKADGQEVKISGDIEVWGIVIASVRERL